MGELERDPDTGAAFDPPMVRWMRPDGSIVPGWHVEAGGRWESLDGLHFFDTGAADRACQFFPLLLRHHIGEFAGQPFELLEYQRKLIVRPLFGWKRIADGFRRFRRVFAFLPKGAGKSPLGSGIGLYCLVMDREPAAEIYAVAADTNQARIVHENAKVMVETSPDLAEELEVLKNSIYDPVSRSVYQVLSSDASTKHGFRPHVVIFDELHAQKSRELFEALKKSMVKRRQPILLIITHSGEDDEGICFEEYEYAKQVLSGAIADETTLPVIFEAAREDDWTDPAVWRKVNPGHGITVKTDAIAAECAEAIAQPRKLNDFLRYHLNRWVNSAVAWIPVDWWDACKDPIAADADLSLLPVAAGLDLAQKWDLAAFVVAFRHRLEDAIPVEVVGGELGPDGEAVRQTVNLNYALTWLPFFWIPEETAREHEKKDGVPYTVFRDAGLLTFTAGATIDYSRIYTDIVHKILPRFPRLKQGSIGYDPAFATDLATSLRDRGGLDVVEVLQNYNHLSETCLITEALIKARRIRHGANRLLRNHVEATAVKRDDAGRIRPVKPKVQKATRHIDGMVAGLMASKVLATVPDTKRSIGVFIV